MLGKNIFAENYNTKPTINTPTDSLTNVVIVYCFLYLVDIPKSKKSIIHHNNFINIYFLSS